MQITIFSHFAAYAHQVGDGDQYPDGPEWSGDVPAQWVIDADAESQLERIFRCFNRVDQADCDRLEEIGYRLPSLSVGDLVTNEDGKVYVVAIAGFKEADADLIAKIKERPRDAMFLVRNPEFGS